MIQAEIGAGLVLLSIVSHNTLFLIAALLLAFIHIPEFISVLDSKIIRRWRARSGGVSASPYQVAETSETDTPLGAASREPNRRLLH